MSKRRNHGSGRGRIKLAYGSKAWWASWRKYVWSTGPALDLAFHAPAQDAFAARLREKVESGGCDFDEIERLAGEYLSHWLEQPYSGSWSGCDADPDDTEVKP